MNTNGYNTDSFFDDGITTDLILEKSGISAIELDATTINFDSFDLTHNGVSLGGAVKNPMTSSLDSAQFNITNVDVLKTNRIQNQTGQNNIQLSTTDIQVSGQIDMLTNDVINIGAGNLTLDSTLTTLNDKTQNLTATALSSILQGSATLAAQVSDNSVIEGYASASVVAVSIVYGFKFTTSVEQRITKIGIPTILWNNTNTTARTFKIWTEGSTLIPVFTKDINRTVVFDSAYVEDVVWILPPGNYRIGINTFSGQGREGSTTLTVDATRITDVIRCFSNNSQSGVYPVNTAAGDDRSYNGRMWFTDTIESNLIIGQSTLTALAYEDVVQFSGVVRSNNILNNQIIVRQASDFGTIDSTKEYFIDGIVDMASISINVPAGGINIVGYNFNLSKLISSSNSYTLITGGGDVIIHDIGIEITGTSSKVYGITGVSGFEAVELSMVNFNNCSSCGVIDNYRQGLYNGCGWFGGSPNLELKGAWLGGFRLSTCIVRSLSSGMTGALFEAGLAFTMQSRFLTDINCDLPVNASLLSFAPSNFPNSSTVQLKNTIVTRNGVINPLDSNLTPNLPASSLSSDFVDNLGLVNTLFGSKTTCTVESTTSIITINVFETLGGTFTPSELVHFDSPNNGELRHISNQPRDYLMFGDLHLTGSSGDLINIRIIKKFANATTATAFQQGRVVQPVTGASPDFVEFNIAANVTLDFNDSVYMEVSNASGTDNVTLTLGSYLFLTNR